MNASDTAYYSRLYRIWSVAAFGAGSRLLAELSERFDSGEELYCAFKDGAEGLPTEAVKAANDVTLSAAEKIMEFCSKKNIQIVTRDEELYPDRLRHIYAPPAVLFYRGDISGIDDRLSIGIVGARKASEYSLKVAAGIARVLGRQGFDIISGFAEGIDICAHTHAIESGAKTYAVLGAGIDYDYPKPNSKYRDAVIENGALITECVPGTFPAQPNFIKRNRILAGLSMSVAVIEAGERSGSLNSASHATSQGKTVFAVPPCDIFDPRYKGNTELIREGAVPLMGARDIFSEYCMNIPHTIVENESICEKIEALNRFCDDAFEAASRQQENDKKDKKHAKPKPEMPAETEPEDKPKMLSEEEIEAAGSDDIQRKILTAINAAPMRADDIAREISENIDDILTALTELEIMGTVTAEGGVYRIS